MIVKFRGKRIDGCNNWVYGSLVTDGKFFFIISSFIVRDNHVLDPICHLVIPETVGQYSCVTDCEEVEIYEGDIVIYKHKVTKQEWTGYIEYDRFNLLVFHCDNWCEEWSDVVHSVKFKGLGELEVIGNIYENKNLLNI